MDVRILMSDIRNKYNKLKMEILESSSQKDKERLLNCLNELNEKIEKLPSKIKYSNTDKNKNDGQKYQLLFKYSNTAIALSNTSGKIVDCNKAFLNLSGYQSIDEIQKSKDWSSYSSRINKDLVQICNTESSSPIENELEFSRKNGERIFVLVKTNCIETDEGKIFVDSMEEITAKKSVITDLVEHKKYLETLFNSINSGVFIVDPETNLIVDINNYALKVLKYEKEDILGKSCLNFFCSNTEENCQAENNKALSFNIERELIAANGKKISVIKSIEEIELKGKKYLLETFSDVSELRRKDEKIAEREGVLKTTIEASDNGILVLDETGNIVSSNRRLYHFWKFDLDEKSDSKVLDRLEDRFSNLLIPEKKYNKFANIQGTDEVICDSLYFNDGRVFERYSAPLVRDGLRAGRVWRFKDITEIIEAENSRKELNEKLEKMVNERTEELRLSENRLNEAQEIAHLGHWVLDLSTNKLNWSDNVYKIFGLNPKQHKAHLEEFGKLIHPDEYKELKDKFVRSLKLKTNFNAEHRIIKADNSILHLKLKCRIFYNVKGRATYALGIVQDITEQVKTAEAMKYHEKQLEMAMEGTGLGLWDWNLLTNQIVINSKFIEMIGYSGKIDTDSISLDFLLAIVHPEDYDNVRDGIEKYSKNGSGHFEQDFRLKSYGASYIWVYARAKIFDWKNNKPTRSIGTFVNITERRQAQTKLQKSEEKFRKLTELSPSPICIQSSDKILFVNTAFVEATGYMANDALDLSFADIVHPDYKELATRYSKSRLLGKSAPTRYEIKLLTKKGEIKWFDISVTVINYEGKQASLAVLIDITRIKTTQQKLKNSQKELSLLNSQKDQFFSIISHDLKGPVGSFMNLAELLRHNKELLTSESADAMIQHLYTLAHKTHRLLENLLLWSKSQLGKIKIKLKMISLTSLVEETTDLLNESMEMKEIEFENLVSKKLEIYADKDSILTVLRNLISNSIKFTPKGGKISCDAKMYKSNGKNKEDYIKISITDNGMGIPKMNVAKLFVPGKEFSTYGTDNEKGTGLGLVLCKELVELNGGTIFAESEEGIGSTFNLKLKCTSKT